jgi:hypothetical protein
MDSNHNGVHDAGESAVPNAVVQAEGSEVVSFSDERGEFALCNLPPRNWKVSVNTQYIVKITKARRRLCADQCSPSSVISDVALGIALPQREVVTSFVKGE